MGHNKQCENLSNFDYFIISSGWAKYYYIYTYIDDDEDDSDDDRWMDGCMDLWTDGVVMGERLFLRSLFSPYCGINRVNRSGC